MLQCYGFGKPLMKKKTCSWEEYYGKIHSLVDLLLFWDVKCYFLQITRSKWRHYTQGCYQFYSWVSGIKSIHTTAVSNTINGYEPNKVLQRIPPAISPDERRLPRSTRTTLAQLRSGYSPLLTSYMSRLDPSLKNECPSANPNLTTQLTSSVAHKGRLLRRRPACGRTR